MRELGPASEKDMVLLFLQEAYSPSWEHVYVPVLEAFHFDRSSLIDNADLSDSYTNCVRESVLGAVRGYGRNELLFKGFPRDTTWRRVSFDRPEFCAVKYIREGNWLARSNGTRSLNDGARNYIKNRKPPSVGNCLTQIETNPSSIPDLIFVEDAQSQLVILEGNTRATAFFIAGTAPISALVGSSPAMDQWDFI